MSIREEVLRARKALLNGDGKLSYFEDRRIEEETVRRAYIGYEPEVYFGGHKGQSYKGPAFTYPCVSENRLLGIHYKGEHRNGEGKRPQKWGGYASDLPLKGHGKKPDASAKIIPFGMETLKDLAPGSLIVLCCGEEDALSIRQEVGYVALSQPGAGLLEPVYAQAFAGFEVIIFYDAGEEQEARKDGLKVIKAGAKCVLAVDWPPDAPHGADINGRLVEDPKGFPKWASAMVAAAQTVSEEAKVDAAKRVGKPDRYGGGASNGKVPDGVGRLLSNVQPEPVDWIWRDRIPKGKLTICEGDPGEGKSAMVTDFAARVSVGRPWPDGAECEAGGVVLCSAEDGEADTIRPRLDAAGGDAYKVLALATLTDGDSERLLSIPEDLGALRQGIEQVKATLVVIDPLSALLSSKVNSHRDQDVRRALAPLAKLAEETGAAVIVVRHLNKASGGNPLYRGGGSIGIIGAARSALLVAKHPDNDRRRVLAPLKSNLARLAPSLAFELTEAANGAVRIEWKGETSHTADTLLAAPVNSEERSALDEAEDFLRATLKDGPRRSTAVKKEAREADISEGTLRRAKRAMGVRSIKDGGLWSWMLPEGADQWEQGAQDEHQVPQASEDEHLEHVEHLPINKGKTAHFEGAHSEDLEHLAFDENSAYLSEGVQGAQSTHVSGDERLAPAINGNSGERCIHEVPGGCWLCQKRDDGGSSR